jgi:hypothetical protein
LEHAKEGKNFSQMKTAKILMPIKFIFALFLLLASCAFAHAQSRKPYADVLVQVQDSYRNQNNVLVIDATGYCRSGSSDRCTFTFICNYGDKSCRSLPPGSSYELLSSNETLMYNCDEYLLYGNSGNADNAVVCLTYAGKAQ